MSVIKFHFFIIYSVTLVSFPLTYLLLQHYEVIMRLTLGILLLNNLLLVLVFFRAIQFKLLFALVFIFIVANLLIGLVNNAFSYRIFLDFLVVSLFSAKIVIFLNLVQYEKYFNLVVSFLKRYMIVSLIAAVVGTMFFYILPQNTGKYVGLTPIVIPYLLYGLLNSKVFVIGTAFLIIFLSGKRAIMLSALFVTLASFIFNDKASKLTRYFLLALVLLLITSVVIFLSDSAALQKVTTTLDVITNMDLRMLSIIIGPRIYEVTSIWQDMNIHDFIFGKGAGYTYDLIIDGLVNKADHANAHFTPVGFVSKYGVILTILFGFVFTLCFFSKSPNKTLFLFLKLYLISFIIESMFSYLIFNDRILPIVLAVLLSNSGKRIYQKYRFV